MFRLLERTLQVSRPLGSAPTPRQQRLHSYYEPVRQRVHATVLNAPISALTRSLSPSHGFTPRAGSVGTRLLTFRARAADQAHAASTPGTTWPIHGHPPGSVPRAKRCPRFRCRLTIFSTLQQRRPARHNTRHDALARLPDPHLTHLVRLFPNAHHDGLQPTQLGVV